MYIVLTTRVSVCVYDLLTLKHVWTVQGSSYTVFIYMYIKLYISMCYLFYRPVLVFHCSLLLIYTLLYDIIGQINDIAVASNASETITIPSPSTGKGGSEAAWIAVAFSLDSTSTTITHTSAKNKPGKAGRSSGSGSKIVLYSPKSETPLCSRDVRVEVSSMVFMPGATIHSLSSPGRPSLCILCAL